MEKHIHTLAQRASSSFSSAKWIFLKKPNLEEEEEAAKRNIYIKPGDALRKGKK